MLDDPKKHFRAVLIDILEHLNDESRQKLSFLLADDVGAQIRDDPTIGGTLNLFQQLIDRGKISEENLSYLIQAFQAIKCHRAANSLKKLQTKLLTSHVPSDFNGDYTLMRNAASSCVGDWLQGMEKDKLNSGYISQKTGNHFDQTGNNNPAVPVIPRLEQTRNQAPLTTTIFGNGDGAHYSRKRMAVMILFTALVVLLSIIAVLYRRKLYPPDPRPNVTTSTVTTHISRLVPKSSLKTTTSSKVDPAEDGRCLKPYGNSCTAAIPDETRAAGLGVYFEYPCSGVGCNFMRNQCRLCAKDPSKVGRPYPKCPECVPNVDGTSQRPSHVGATACQLPRTKSCTAATTDETRAAGLGVYFEYPCSGVGCNFYRPYCRLCAKDPWKVDRPYPKCPQCVV